MPSSRIRFPIASRPAQYVFANCSFTIATGRDPARSSSVKARPRLISTRMVLK